MGFKQLSDLAIVFGSRVLSEQVGFKLRGQICGRREGILVLSEQVGFKHQTNSVKHFILPVLSEQVGFKLSLEIGIPVK